MMIMMMAMMTTVMICKGKTQVYAPTMKPESALAVGYHVDLKMRQSCSDAEEAMTVCIVREMLQYA